MFIAALLMGLAGSLHCVGMCSPLAAVVFNLQPSMIMNRLVYNGGRILTYSILGAAAGSAGWIVPLSKVQYTLSFVTGVIMLIIAFMGTGNIRIVFLSKILSRIQQRIKIIFSKFLMKKTLASVFLMGSVNGLLPCGLTLIAITFCLTLGNPLKSFSYMLWFGMGTLPVMLGFTSLVQVMVNKFRINYEKMTRALLILSGIILIARVFLIHTPDPEQQHLVDIIICR
jgi:sulfite exporter TauE/SafE